MLEESSQSFLGPGCRKFEFHTMICPHAFFTFHLSSEATESILLHTFSLKSKGANLGYSPIHNLIHRLYIAHW